MLNALRDFNEIDRQLVGRRPSVFLDYDGVLTPIVDRPDLAILDESMRAALQRLAEMCSVAVVSGRDLEDVRRHVGLADLTYAGSHGFDIAGPNGLRIEHEQGAAFTEAVKKASAELTETLSPVEGALIEPKKFAVAVHYRLVADSEVDWVEAMVDEALKSVPELHKTHGKMVFELRPRFEWDKGKAVLWLLDALGQTETDVLPFYLGDDITDEDAFQAPERRRRNGLCGRGTGNRCPLHPGGSGRGQNVSWTLSGWTKWADFMTR